MQQLYTDKGRLGLAVLLGLFHLVVFGGAMLVWQHVTHTPVKPWQIVAAVAILALLTVGTALLVLWLLRPLPPGPARWEVFIRADPETVWDTYHPHVKQAQYRPGRRIISVEQISEAPLTYRCISQMDFLPSPTTSIQRYPVYERPTHYVEESEFELDGDRLAGREEGWLDPSPGGTTLRIATWLDQDRPWLPAKIAWARVNKNMQALAAYCESRPVAPPRAPLAESWFSRNGFFVVLALYLAASWLVLPAWAALIPWCIWWVWMAVRGARLARRIF